ncbi:MAG TPA: FadR/GntR family transcriptional regulator [Ramlibacter sp.]|nr:FadR/GntR family transcriptional regulator [Ramlibacter sp.]
MELLTRLPGGETDIVKRTVKDQIADKLAYMVISGLLQPGDELPSERALAGTLQVSRETVRSALAVLQARGMLDVSQGARTRVVGPAGQTLAGSVRALAGLKDKPVDEVAEARAQVEQQVVKLAAARMRDADLERLRELLREQRGMLADPVAFQISDREFHMVIYAASGNALLRDFVSDMYDYALDYRRQALTRRGAIARSVEDHERIVAALATHDPAQAEAAMTRHLHNVHSTTRLEMAR